MATIPKELQKQALKWSHSNHMGIEKMRLLAHKSIYWISINADIGNAVNNCFTCPNFQEVKPKERIIHHEIPGKPWGVIFYIIRTTFAL